MRAGGRGSQRRRAALVGPRPRGPPQLPPCRGGAAQKRRRPTPAGGLPSLLPLADVSRHVAFGRQLLPSRACRRAQQCGKHGPAAGWGRRKALGTEGGDHSDVCVLHRSKNNKSNYLLFKIQGGFTVWSGLCWENESPCSVAA